MRLQLAQHARVVLPDGSERALPPLDAALLAWLALEGPTPRQRLAQLLWPDKEDEAARNSLRQRLFKLRRAVGADLVVGNTLLALAETVTHDLAQADAVLGDTPSDTLAAGDYARWLATQREQRREQARRTLVAQAEAAEAAGAWPEAQGVAAALLQRDPLSEEAHRRVMRLHYLAGDRAAALVAFDRCERLLKDEVGTRPSPETLALLALVEGAQAAPAALPAARVPPSVQRPPRLVGREAAWAALHAAWQAGLPVCVLGEAGMGKTRLATDFAAAQGRTLVSGARPGDQGVVYAAVSRLLRALPRESFDTLAPGVRGELARLLPELGEAPPADGEAARARLFNAVATLLQGLHPVVQGVVFEDLHFADAASAELLQGVSAGARQRWLFTGREAELPAAARALLDGADGGVERVVLQPLSQAEVEAFLASLAVEGLDSAAAAPALLRHTGGNPLFLLETLKTWLTQAGGAPGAAPLRLPAVRSVAALIERRIGRLSPPAVQLARCAAVATPDFGIELAARVLGVRTIDLADPWAELEAAQVLREGAFAHDLIYDSALASVPQPVKRQLHAEIAAFLAERGGAAARIAHHWLAAGNEARALEALVTAAADACHAMRKREEIELRERAVEIAERLGRTPQAFECALRNFEALMVADRTRVDDATLARLDRLAQTPQHKLRALLAQADFLMCMERFAEAVPRAERAAELARAQGERVREIEAVRCAAACNSFGGHTQRAVALLRPVLPWVLEGALPLEDAQSYFNDLACCLDNADQPREAVGFHRRALDTALATGRLDQAAVSGANMAASHKAAGRVQQALDSLLQARRHAAALDTARGAAYHLDVMLLALRRDLAQYAQAIEAAEVALESMAQNPARAPVVQGHVASLWLLVGQPARARQALDAAQGAAVAPQLQARLSQLEGRWRLARGQRGAAEVFVQAQQQAPRSGRTAIVSLVALDHARTLPPAEALVACERVADRCGALGYDGVRLSAWWRAADHALALGEVATALHHARAALQAPPELTPDDLDPAERFTIGARVLDAAGETAACAALLSQAARWLESTRAALPPHFRAGFVEQQPAVQALRAQLAAHALAGPA